MARAKKTTKKTQKAPAAQPDTTHNGWKNYETWAVALWIDNEEPSYNKARRMARECAELAAEQKADAEGPALRAGRLVFPRSADGMLADRLKEWMEEEMPNLGGTLWADLLGAAMSEVDWYEIAHNMAGD